MARTSVSLGPYEAQIQAEILAYLELRGDVFVWRNNSGVFSPRPGAFVRAGVKGGSDVVGLWAPSGRLLAVEVKRKNGKLTPEQEQFLSKVNAFGGVGFAARSVGDVRARLGEPQVRISSGRVLHGVIDD